VLVAAFVLRAFCGISVCLSHEDGVLLPLVVAVLAGPRSSFMFVGRPVRLLF